MNFKIIILYAKPWTLVDESTKQTRSGISIRYVMADSLDPKVDAASNTLGYDILKVSLDPSQLSKLTSVPGVYSANFRLVSKKDSSSLVPESVEFETCL